MLPTAPLNDLISDATLRRVARSALPGAPVVDHVAPRRVRLAAALRRRRR